MKEVSDFGFKVPIRGSSAFGISHKSRFGFLDLLMLGTLNSEPEPSLLADAG